MTVVLMGYNNLLKWLKFVENIKCKPKDILKNNVCLTIN